MTPEQEVGSTLVTALKRHHDNPGIPVLLSQDLFHAGRIASMVERGTTLPSKEAREAYRILTRADLAVAGLDLPTQPGSDGRPVPGAPVAPAQGSVTAPIVRFRRDGAWYGISVTRAFAFKETLKDLGARPHKDGSGFEWRLPPTPAMAAAVLDALAGAHALASDGVREMADRFHAQADHRMVLDESAPLPVFDTTALIKPGFSLWDHQVRAIDYASKVTACQLAIPMGGGKTLATIATANKVEAKRIVIAAPNKVRGVWPREVRKFSQQNWHIVSGFRESKRARSGRVSLNLADRLRQAEECLFDCGCGAPTHAVVINYEALASEPWANWKPPVMLDLFVMDEVHRVKAPTGTISRNLAKWVDFTQRRIGLTGTPMPQTPLDVFGIFRALDPGIFGTKWTAFRRQYAVENPHVPGHIVDYKNVEELRNKFYSISYLPTVDLKLPAITDITREFELEPAARKAYDSLDQSMFADLTAFASKAARAEALALARESEQEELARWMDSGDVEDYLNGEGAADEDSTVTPANVMVRLLRLQQFTGGTVIDDNKERIRVSHNKANELEDVLADVGCVASEDENITPEPVVVFCRFRSDLDAVKEIAEKNKLRYAEVSGRRHDGLTADSEMNPNCDVLGVQIQSGGTGVDLTHSHIVIWYSMGYSLSDYDQARKRLHRPGQTKPVLSIHLLAEGTADMDVYQALDQRRSVIAGVLDARGVDPASLGIADFRQTKEEIEMLSGKGSVPLPFDRILNKGKASVGEPGRKSR